MTLNNEEFLFQLFSYLLTHIMLFELLVNSNLKQFYISDSMSREILEHCRNKYNINTCIQIPFKLLKFKKYIR